MFGFERKKSTTQLLEKMSVELEKGKNYIIVVPNDVEPDEVIDGGFFDELNVFVIQAGKLTIVEIE